MGFISPFALKAGHIFTNRDFSLFLPLPHAKGLFRGSPGPGYRARQGSLRLATAQTPLTEQGGGRASEAAAGHWPGPLSRARSDLESVLLHGYVTAAVMGGRPAVAFTMGWLPAPASQPA